MTPRDRTDLGWILSNLEDLAGSIGRMPESDYKIKAEVYMEDLYRVVAEWRGSE